MIKTGLKLVFIFTVFSLSPLHGADRAPINVNLIIDSTSSLTGVKTDMTAWLNGHLDSILAEGDRVTVWSAGPSSRVIYTGTMNNTADRNAAKKSIQDISGSGDTADFSGALQDASGQQISGYSYTLLISASASALTALISGPQSNLLRFSRMEEYSGWRAIIVGLNMETRVRRAAAAFFGS